MKKILLTGIIYIFQLSISFAQNNDITISYLANTGGKAWVRSINPDGPKVADSRKNEVYIFHEGGVFTYIQNNTTARAIPIASRWSYDPTTNKISFDITLTNKEKIKCVAEITYIDDERIVMNLSENESDNTIFVLIKK